MNILHLVADVGTASGGMGPSILGLAQAQRDLGDRPTIWCLDYHDSSAEFAEQAGVEIKVWPRSRPHSLGYSAQMERAVREEKAPPFDVVHQHGMWLRLIHTSTLMKQRYGIPTIFAPEGSLNPYCLKISRWKKRIAMVLYQRENLQSFTSLLCLSETEASDSRKFGLPYPIDIVPSGISDQWLCSVGSADRFRSRYSIPEGKRIMLFVSRLHPQKGLPMFLSVMRSMPVERLKDWVLVIAGPNQNGHVAELEALSLRYGLTDHVKIVGPIYGQTKRDAFEAAELFVLPSYSEASSIAVLEAMAVSMPVITTTGTPWQDLVQHGCGWWVSADHDGLLSALCDASSKSPEELGAMGTRGRALVEEKYTWSMIARSINEVYCRSITRERTHA
jgi:glycosyltransferase involved in cell wall biosynthesis